MVLQETRHFCRDIESVNIPQKKSKVIDAGSYRIIPAQMRLVISLQGKTGSVMLDFSVTFLSQKTKAIHDSPDIVKKEITKAESHAKD